MLNNDSNQIATAKASAAGMARGAGVSRFQNTGASRSSVRASAANEAIADALGDRQNQQLDSDLAAALGMDGNLFSNWRAEDADKAERDRVDAEQAEWEAAYDNDQEWEAEMIAREQAEWEAERALTR